jgi:hypothetical protein
VPLDRAIVLARQLDVGVLETWARTMLAVELARSAAPDAELAARSAEACARGAEVPAAPSDQLVSLPSHSSGTTAVHRARPDRTADG